MTMPESESEKYDIRRSHRRKDAESRGARDRHANEERGGQEGQGGQDEQLPETD
jgi:hypothetical protein